MRAIFLISDTGWSARARAFVLAAKGLAARGHDVQLACQRSCPVQVRVAEEQLKIAALDPGSKAGTALQLRQVLRAGGVDALFVNDENEQLVASSAVRLGHPGARVIRRVPPFAIVRNGQGSRWAARMAPAGLLFTTEGDYRSAAASSKVSTTLAPLAVDPGEHERVAEASRNALRVPADALLVVCVYDGTDRHRALTPMRMLALLAPRHPELHVAFIGVPDVDELRMQGAALGINGRISYLGARADELSVLKAADVGWIAASGDAAALAALDFMALRKPIVAERNRLAEHYVADGIGGLLLPSVELSSTAASVAAFLAREERRAAMGKAGYARLTREFGFDTMIAGYEQAVAGAAGRVPQPA